MKRSIYVLFHVSRKIKNLISNNNLFYSQRCPSWNFTRLLAPQPLPLLWLLASPHYLPTVQPLQLLLLVGFSQNFSVFIFTQLPYLKT